MNNCLEWFKVNVLFFSSPKVEKYVPAVLEPEDLTKHNRRLKIKAKLKKRKEKKIRIQKLRDEIAIWEKKKSDKLMKSQIFQDLTNEFPETNLKMVSPVKKVSDKCL